MSRSAEHSIALGSRIERLDAAQLRELMRAARRFA